jgi:hypothetical protein
MNIIEKEFRQFVKMFEVLFENNCFRYFSSPKASLNNRVFAQPPLNINQLDVELRIAVSNRLIISSAIVTQFRLSY